MSSDFKKPKRSYSGELRHSQRKRRHRDHRDQEWLFGRTNSKARGKRLIQLGLVLGAILLAGAIAGFLTISRKKTPITAPANRVIPAGQDGNLWQGPRPNEVVDRFLAATTHEERLKWVRDPDAVSAIMDQFYTQGSGSREKVVQVTDLVDSPADEIICSRFKIDLNDGSRRLLSVTYGETGEAAVDFKSYALWCSESWDALLDGSVQKADEMRVLLQPSNYYNLDFSDETVWQCWVATNPELEAPIYVYSRRDDEDMARSIRKLIQNYSVRMTIAIEGMDQSYRHRQFVMTRILHGDWLEE